MEGPLKEPVVAERDTAPEETREETREETGSRADRLIASAAFPALVALWFAGLFGLGFLFLPPVLFDALFGDLSLFGAQTRVIVALGAAGLGLLLGLFIANRVRSEQPVDMAPAPTRKRQREARAPLDVRAALGLPHEDDEDDDIAAAPAPTRDDEDADADDALELSDEHYDLHDEDDRRPDAKPPIDDPFFASAWSDAAAPDVPAARPCAAQPDFDIEPGEARHDPFALLGGDEPDRDDDWDEPLEMPVHRARPTRYNPFADHIADRDEEPALSTEPAREPSEDRTASSTVESTHEAPRMPRRSPSAPPPPPAWPEPREQEPALSELGVAELVERLARALQRDDAMRYSRPPRTTRRTPPLAPDFAPPRTGRHRNESALAPGTPPSQGDIDEALRRAIERFSRLDDVA